MKTGGKPAESGATRPDNHAAFETDHLLDDLGKHTANGSILGIGAQALSMAVQLAIMVVLARLISPEDFGLVAMAAVVTGFVAMFTSLGLPTATVQRQSIDQNLVSAFLYINLAMGMVIGLLMVALAPLAATIFDEPRVELIIVAFAISVPVSAAGQQHAALMQRAMRWKAIHSINISAQLIAGIVAVVLAWTSGLGVWALVAQAWVGTILATLAFWAVCRWRPGRVLDWSAVREPMRFGIHLALFSFLNFFHRQFDDGLVGWKWGATQLGLYTRAYGLFMLPVKLINGPASGAIIPALSRLNDQPDRWEAYYQRVLKTTVLITAPLGGLLILNAGLVVRLAYGPSWEGAVPIFQLLSLSIFAQPIMNSTGWLWVSAGQTNKMVQWAALSIPLLVAGMLCGLPFGPTGLAAGYAASFVLLTPVCTWFAARELPFSVAGTYKAVMPPILVSIVLMVLAYAWLTFRTGTIFEQIIISCVFLAIYLAVTLAMDRQSYARLYHAMRSIADFRNLRKPS